MAWNILSDAPDIIIGWASIEQPEMRNRLYNYQKTLIHALHISTSKGLSGGVEFGYLGFTHDTFNVLYVQPVSGDKNERVGVGRIFDKDFFRSVAMQEAGCRFHCSQAAIFSIHVDKPSHDNMRSPM